MSRSDHGPQVDWRRFRLDVFARCDRPCDLTHAVGLDGAGLARFWYDEEGVSTRYFLALCAHMDVNPLEYFVIL